MSSQKTSFSSYLEKRYREISRVPCTIDLRKHRNTMPTLLTVNMKTVLLITRNGYAVLILGLCPANGTRRNKVTWSPLAGRKPRISPRCILKYVISVLIAAYVKLWTLYFSQKFAINLDHLKIEYPQPSIYRFWCTGSFHK